MHMAHSRMQPASAQAITRLLTALLLALALAAGYYYTAYDNQLKKYAKLEDKYVRVRSVLGREETQRLIDRSYESDPPQHQEDW